MRKLIFAFLIMALCVSFTTAQNYNIKKVWEFLPTVQNDAHPWLKAKNGTNSEHDGTNTMDFSSELVRYDASRLMLMIVENGIDEATTTTTAEQQAIAAKFPDRSIIWINPVDGSPMGVALTIGQYPSKDTYYYIQKCKGLHPDGPTTERLDLLREQYPHFAVDGDGYVYVCDKHKVLRYKPSGNTFTGPEIVFEYPEQDPPIWMGDTTNMHFRSWAIKSINIKGKGNNKIMTTAGRHWLDGGGVMVYSSTDGGATFKIQTYHGQGTSLTGTGGTCSSLITMTKTNEEYVFSTGFPGSADRLFEFYRTASTSDPLEQLDNTFFGPTGDPADLPEESKYSMWNMIDIAATDTLPYVAVLTLPKWQSSKEPNLTDHPEWAESTSWVALHSITLDPNQDGTEGDFLSSYQIKFREQDEPQGVAGDEDNWDAAYYASIKMDIPAGFPSGTAEILWSGGTSGFGRLVVGDVVVGIDEWSLF